MQTSSSANRTWREFSSASENTATVLMPSSRHAKMIRSATSPRLAIRIFLNMRRADRGRPGGAAPRLPGPYRKQPLAVLDRLPALNIDVHDLAVVLRFDFVHQLHRFDDAEHLSLFHLHADVDKRRRGWLGRSVERAHNRGFHNGELEIDVIRPAGTRPRGSRTGPSGLSVVGR